MVCSNVLFLYVIPCHEFYQNLHSLYHFDATRLTVRKGENSTGKSQMSYSENKFQFFVDLFSRVDILRGI